MATSSTGDWRAFVRGSAAAAVRESCRNELKELNAPEHLDTSSRPQAQAPHRSAHRDAYRMFLDPNRSLY
jgi:hypothetical protein